MRAALSGIPIAPSRSPMQTRGERLETLLAALLQQHGLGEREEEALACLRTLTTASLAVRPSGGRRLSSLTSDGLPFELSLALGPGAPGGLRYAAEAGDLRAPFRERLRHGEQTTGYLLDHIGAATLRGIHQRLGDALFPMRIRTGAEYRFGLWHGLAHRPHAPALLKVYYNLRPWENDHAAALAATADALGPALAGAGFLTLGANLPAGSRPAFLCVEGGAADPPRVKLYHRCHAPVASATLADMLAAYGVARHRTVFEEFHRSLADTRDEYPARALMLCVGIGGGQWNPDLTCYFDLNHHFHDDASARGAIIVLLDAMGIDPLPYARALDTLSGGSFPMGGLRYHTMISLGLAAQTWKINIYLKPTWASLECPAEALRTIVPAEKYPPSAD